MLEWTLEIVQDKQFIGHTFILFLDTKEMQNQKAVWDILIQVPITKSGIDGGR